MKGGFTWLGKTVWWSKGFQDWLEKGISPNFFGLSFFLPGTEWVKMDTEGSKPKFKKKTLVTLASTYIVFKRSTNFKM